MIIVEVIFWLSVITLVYTYLGYPLLLGMFAFLFSRPVQHARIFPSVSLVVSAYNEESVLADKIENALQAEYPELIEIAVISDGSTDRTGEIISEFARRDKRVSPCIVFRNQGKTACLNEFVPGLKGDIVVFTDANAFYPTDLIANIVCSFADETIGFVTGGSRYFKKSGARDVDATGLYSKLEQKIKSLESRTGSCVGADGPVFSIRCSLYASLNVYDINDFVLPLNIVKQGYRGIFDESVLCKENAADSTQGEFKRQMRITAEEVGNLVMPQSLLGDVVYPIFSLKLFSHKLLKFMGPLFILSLLISSAVLAFSGKMMFYRLGLVVQLLLYVLAFSGLQRKRYLFVSRAASFANMFLVVNFAYLVGWYKVIKGETFVSWSPERK